MAVSPKSAGLGCTRVSRSSPGSSPARASKVAEPLIALRGITKRFGEGSAAFQALKGVDLDVASGDFVAIMGASGSGKSTTMNILGCLDVPTSGSYLFRAVQVEGLSRDQRSLLRRRYLGFVFQGFTLLARTTALENVALAWLYRVDSRRVRSQAGVAGV